MAKAKQVITIAEAIQTVPGFRIPYHNTPKTEYLPNFYCNDSSVARNHYNCQSQCDVCRQIVKERQEQTQKL